MKKKIIVVDDEPLIPILMKEVIEEDQELVVAQVAYGKDEFLKLVSQEFFDAGLIDISLGGREGGLELIQIMKSKTIDLPLIVLSAHDELLYALKCLQAGAKGYINKRYICTDVVRCLKEVLGGNLFVTGDRGESIIKQYREWNPSITLKSF